MFQRVELLDGDAAHFGPGPILKRVVVEELAPEEQCNGQHSPDLTLGRLEWTSSA